MYYVSKPVPLEAVFLATPGAGLQFLDNGEYVLVGAKTLTVREADGTLIKAHVGEDYLVRHPVDGIQVWTQEAFEAEYIPLAPTNNDMTTGTFDAYENEDGTWTVECAACGPIGVTTDENEFGEVGFQHLVTAHLGLEA